MQGAQQISGAEIATRHVIVDRGQRDRLQYEEGHREREGRRENETEMEAITMHRVAVYDFRSPDI